MKGPLLPYQHVFATAYIIKAYITHNHVFKPMIYFLCFLGISCPGNLPFFRILYFYFLFLEFSLYLKILGISILGIFIWPNFIAPCLIHISMLLTPNINAVDVKIFDLNDWPSNKFCFLHTIYILEESIHHRKWLLLYLLYAILFRENIIWTPK